MLIRGVFYEEATLYRQPDHGNLKQAKGGVAVSELCREHGMSNASFYKWRAKYDGMDTSMITRMKELEDENRRLKKMHAKEKLKAEIAREAIEKIPSEAGQAQW